MLITINEMPDLNLGKESLVSFIQSYEFRSGKAKRLDAVASSLFHLDLEAGVGIEPA